MLYWVVSADRSMSYENLPSIFFLHVSLINLWSSAVVAVCLPLSSRWPHHADILSNFQSELVLWIHICTSLSHIKITSQVYSKLLVEIFYGSVKSTIVFTWQTRLSVMSIIFSVTMSSQEMSIILQHVQLINMH